MGPPCTDALIQFGAFQFDEAAGGLRKIGLRIHLAGQPLAILGLLLQRAGDLVNRDELREHLWPRRYLRRF